MSFYFLAQTQPQRSNTGFTFPPESFTVTSAMNSATSWCGFNVSANPGNSFSRRMIAEISPSAQVYHQTSNQTISLAPSVPPFVHDNQTVETLRPLYTSVPLQQFSDYNQLVTQQQSMPLEIDGTTYYLDHSLAARPCVPISYSILPENFNNVSVENTYHSYMPAPPMDTVIMPTVAQHRSTTHHLSESQNQQPHAVQTLPPPRRNTASPAASQENTPSLLFDIQDIMSLQLVIMEKLKKPYNTQFLDLLYINIPANELKKIEKDAAKKMKLVGKNQERYRLDIYTKPKDENELLQQYEDLGAIICTGRHRLYKQRTELMNQLAFGLKNTSAFEKLAHSFTEGQINQESFAIAKQMNPTNMLNLISMFFGPYQKVKSISLRAPYLTSVSTLYATTDFDVKKNIVQRRVNNDNDDDDDDEEENIIKSPVFTMLCSALHVFQQSFSIKMEYLQSQAAGAHRSSDENTNKENLRQYFYCFCDFALKCTIIFEKENLESTVFRYILGQAAFFNFIVQLSEYQQDYKDDFIYIIYAQLSILNSYRVPQIVHGINQIIQTQINQPDVEPIIQILIDFLVPLWKSLCVTLESSLSCQRLDLAFSHFEIIRKGYFFAIQDIKKILSQEQKILLQEIEHRIARCCCVVLLQLSKVLCDNSKSYSEGLDPFIRRLENDILPMFEDIKNQLLMDNDTTIEKRNCQICMMQNALEQIKANISAIDPQLKVSNTLIDDLLRSIHSTVENIEQKEKEKHHSLGTTKKCRTLLRQQPLTSSAMEPSTNTITQVVNDAFFSAKNTVSKLIDCAEDIIQSFAIKEALEQEDLDAVQEHCSCIADYPDFLCWAFGELAFQTYFSQRKEFVRALKYIEQSRELYTLCKRLCNEYDLSSTSLTSVEWLKKNNPSASLKESNIISVFALSTQSKTQQLSKSLILMHSLYENAKQSMEKAMEYFQKQQKTSPSQGRELMSIRQELFILHLKFLEQNSSELASYQVLMEMHDDTNALIMQRQELFKKLGLYGNNLNRSNKSKSNAFVNISKQHSKKTANPNLTTTIDFSFHSEAFKLAREKLQENFDK